MYCGVNAVAELNDKNNLAGGLHEALDRMGNRLKGVFQIWRLFWLEAEECLRRIQGVIRLTLCRVILKLHL